MSKIELAKVKSLSFYNDAVTAARRTAPMPQLVCVGKPCRVFQPEAVRCVNLGGSGTDVDWKVTTHVYVTLILFLIILRASVKQTFRTR